MSLKTRGFAAALAAALAGLPISAAGAAQSAAVDIGVFLPNALVSPGSDGTIVRVHATASEAVTLHNFKLEVDLSDLAGVATVTPDFTGPGQECETTATSITCVTDSFTIFSLGSASLTPPLKVRPASGAALGANGTWTATISADGVAPVSTESQVSVVEGVDLGVPPAPTGLKATPGSQVDIPLDINNVGQTTADGAVVWFASDYPITFGKQYSNCTYAEGQLRSCAFDEQLTPGGSYTTSEPVPFKLRPDTAAPGNAAFQILWLTKADFEVLKQGSRPAFFGQPGTGGKLALVAKPELRSAAQTDINRTNDSMTVEVEVEGDNDADLAAIGGSASGAVGHLVAINAGLRNLGPATFDVGSVGGGAGVVVITLPPGTGLTEMPAGCWAMKRLGDDALADTDPDNLQTRFLQCRNEESVFLAGTETFFPLKLRIDQVIAGAAGTVQAPTENCEGCREDKNPANNTANIVLNAPALPTTGVQTGLIAGAGVLLALVGAAAFVLGRRRTLKFVA
ncbi:MAG TPA: hypothetical protein VF062_06685 [Candidatus Limnocylindrales bacterium]